MAPTPSATPNRTGVRIHRRCRTERRSEFTEPVGAAYAADMTVRVSDVSFGVRRTSALARRMSAKDPQRKSDRPLTLPAGGATMPCFSIMGRR